MTIRRTEEEIKADFPHALKLKGVKLEDWKRNKKIEETRHKTKMLLDNIRRTKKEIKAGFPIEKKRAGITLDQWLEKRAEENAKLKPIGNKVESKLQTRKEEESKTKTKRKDLPATHVLIVNDKEDEKTIERIVREAVEYCKWEWKMIPLDNKFKIQMLKTLGDQGWKLAFILENSIVNPNSNKPDMLSFQRIQIKKGKNVGR